MAIRCFELIALRILSTAVDMPASLNGSYRSSRRGERNRRASSGAPRPRMQSKRAVTGDTPSSCESATAGASSHAIVCQIRSALIDPDIPHRAELLVARVESYGRIRRPHLRKRPFERRIEQRGRPLVVRVRAADRFDDDL